MSRAVVLDRDGVLNEAPVVDGIPRAPATVDAVRILADAPAGCRVLREAGFLLICVTNQPEISRGGVRADEVEAINALLTAKLELTEVVVCPHQNSDGCECRKPKPGMSIDAARRHGINLAESFTVGDRWRDMEAGHSAGTRTVFVDRHYDEPLTVAPDAVVAGLKEASQWIVGQTRQ